MTLLGFAGDFKLRSRLLRMTESGEGTGL